MKNLKMRGLIMADVKVIKAMDNNIDGTSKIIPASINKSGSIGANTSGATEEQFKLLRKHIQDLLKEMGSEIASGKVDIKPYKKKNINACTYCSFHSICQFDVSRKYPAYKRRIRTQIQSESGSDFFCMVGEGGFEPPKL